MRFIGIDIASEKHFVAIVGEASEVLAKSTSFGEDVSGYGRLFELIGEPTDTLVAMEATGHYWKNLFAALAARGFSVALLNPLRTRRFAEEDLQRTKTDAIDALGIARFAAQKRPAVSRMPDSATEEVRELVRHRDRLMQEFGDKTRQLHRLVDLGFPELTRYVRRLDSQLATALLAEYPTAQAFAQARPKALANLKYDGRHFVGLELAMTLIEAGRRSVGAHHAYAYRLQVKHACQDLDVLRERLRSLDRDVESKLGEHEIGQLLTTIDGVGPTTAAKLIAELGNPADFTSPGALAAYVGVVPATKQSGRSSGTRFGISQVGNTRLRHALWMPVLTAVRKNPWLSNYYARLRANGKPPKVALIAAMRKLLHAVYAVARDRKPFTPKLAGALA